ncbi:hypothetical protein DSOUD_0836 [Desulfuromonas soudanensis]|uniref:Uncharacterized protein n=1 Tax=Desulfuromonas soudanensis TaxID=1603606 RepID=A0A0M3QF82_9BACT|nr:hypothetical protein DSOUD_0836 [Desulfuromonas soudanensis]
MRWVMASVLFAGLALAGSEGPLFPGPNLVGVGLIMLFAAVMRRQEVGSGQNDGQAHRRS